MHLVSARTEALSGNVSDAGTALRLTLIRRVVMLPAGSWTLRRVSIPVVGHLVPTPPQRAQPRIANRFNLALELGESVQAALTLL